MQLTGYILFRVFTWILTLLPLSVLYVLSDFLYLILYYFPSYRRSVVAMNLRNSFPEKTEEELKLIAKKFYHHLADLFIEFLKLTQMSEKEQNKRMTFTNLEAFDKFYDEGRDIAAIVGHYNNWEWTNIMQKHIKYQLVPIYKPLENKYFDNYVKKLRAKHGAILAPMSGIVRDIIKFRKEKIRIIPGFISDQTPAKHDINYWTTFLNQDTPVFTGAEKIAIKYDMAIIFMNLQKVKRGYYNLTIETLFEHTAGLSEHVITEAHVRRLEQLITEKPEFWLWSHKRWKHKKPAGNA